MSWTDFYRRRDALDAVLEQARRDPASTAPFASFASIPQVAAEFARPEDLLLALHHRWSLRLTGQLGVALSNPDIDPVDAVLAGWRTTAAANPELRDLLDRGAREYPDVVRPAVDGEQRLLAHCAGLAEADDSPEEVTRLGATLLALLRNGSERPARRRSPVEQLLRRLVASA
jgi:hypothetical protein